MSSPPAGKRLGRMSSRSRTAVVAAAREIAEAEAARVRAVVEAEPAAAAARGVAP